MHAITLAGVWHNGVHNASLHAHLNLTGMPSWGLHGIRETLEMGQKAMEGKNGSTQLPEGREGPGLPGS